MVGFFSISFYLNLVPRAALSDLIVVGLINGVIVLFSILIHELSHSIVAQKYGLNVSEIELFLFGGVSKIEEEPKAPKSEITISIVGPLSSLLIGTSLLALIFLPIRLPNILLVTLSYSGISNIGLSIFNLLPAFPFDGGRILRALLWKRKNDFLSATKTASRVGVIFGYGFIFYGFFQIFNIGLFNGLWFVLIGSFLISSAKQSYLQTKDEFILSHIKAKDMLNLPNQRIPFNMPVEVALREYFIPYKRSYFPVIQEDGIVGIIYIKDIKKIPIWQRSDLIIGDIMRRISEFPSINDQQSGKEALKKLYKDPLLLIVKEKNNEEILGYIGKNELITSLEFWSLHTENA